MSFYLVHRSSPEAPQFKKQPFGTEPEAVIQACALIAAGTKGDFIVEDDQGQIVTNNFEIRNRCKAVPSS
jgi:hypothetical protein